MENKKRVEDIPYMEILKKSFHLSWKNKLLWWFGFLIALSSPGSLNINFPWNGNTNPEENILTKKDQLMDFLKPASNFFDRYLLWIIIGAAVALAIFIVLYILGKIGRGALIKSIKKINSNEKNGFKLGFSEGKKYLWKILGLDILLGLSLTIIILIVISPCIILFIYKAYIAGIFLMLIAIIFSVVSAILVSFLRNYGHLYIVLGDLPIWRSIENSYILFRKNFWPSIIMSLINIGVGIVLGIPLLMFLFSFIILGLAGGFLAYYILNWIGVVIFIILALLILLVIVFLVRSFAEVFFQTAWLLFFQEIATQSKAEEAIVEKVLETKPEVNPAESANLTEN